MYWFIVMDSKNWDEKHIPNDSNCTIWILNVQFFLKGMTSNLVLVTLHKRITTSNEQDK